MAEINKVFNGLSVQGAGGAEAAGGTGAAEPQGGGKADFLKIATQIIMLVKQLIESLGGKGKAADAPADDAAAAGAAPADDAAAAGAAPADAAAAKKADAPAAKPAVAADPEGAVGGNAGKVGKAPEINGAKADKADTDTDTDTDTAGQVDVSAMFKTFMETGMKMFEKSLAKQG
jgi:hypothetical protein